MHRVVKSSHERVIATSLHNLQNNGLYAFADNMNHEGQQLVGGRLYVESR